MPAYFLFSSLIKVCASKPYKSLLEFEWSDGLKKVFDIIEKREEEGVAWYSFLYFIMIEPINGRAVNIVAAWE